MSVRKTILISICVSICVQFFIAGALFAQRVETVPLFPQQVVVGGAEQQSTGQAGVYPFQLQQPASQQQTARPSTPQAQFPDRQSYDRSSEFEDFVSGKVLEVNEFEFEILRRFEGVSFQYTARSLSQDKIALPVKVLKVTKKLNMDTPGDDRRQRRINDEVELSKTSVVVDAGYIVGTPDLLRSALRLLGVKNSLSVSMDIKQFGYELFSQQPSTFAPVEKVPVGPDYVIGPGDEIRLSVWGKVEGQWTVTVDRDGNITIPKSGVVGVTGLSFKELKDVINRELSKYYTGFETSVSLGSLRTIRVYVVGNAQKPGAYTVSSLSTLVNAVFEAGGPSKNGSMRDIQLKRSGKTVVSLDMYDFLLKGDKGMDRRLMPEDVIFIPPVGPMAGIAGSVNTPAIYELKGERTIAQLIALAGGLSEIAFKGRLQVERVVDSARQTVFESEYAGSGDMQIQGGDVVKIFPVVQDRRVVRINGAVQREGEYGYRDGMTVKDLISMSGGLKYYAFRKEAEISRTLVTSDGPRTEKIMIDLDKVLAEDQSGNIKLRNDDVLFIRKVPEWQVQSRVNIQGEVKFPGTYTVKKGEKISSLIERAGGFTDNAYLRGAIFVRERVKELQQKSLEEMALRLERELIVGASLQSSTAISQEEILSKRLEAEQKQEFIRTVKRLQATGRMSVKIAHSRLMRGSEYDIELEDGDYLYVPMKNSVVNVIGAVMSQGSFVFSEKLDYQDYVSMTGGYSRFADPDNVYVLKADGSARKLSSGFMGWNPSRSRWEITAFGENIREVEPGDTIVVSEKLERIAWMRDLKDITQILMQMAVTAATVIKLY